MSVPDDARARALDLIDFIDASPSPWHAVRIAAARLGRAGFVRLDETQRWQLQPGGRYFVVRGGSSLVAFVLGGAPLEKSGFRLVGAHTDSPGLRLKPRAAHLSEGMCRLGVEVYGGPILATFADRDLSLAGRVGVRGATGADMRLVQFATPLVRLPNLAIHMNREVNEQGLKLNKQTELPLILCAGDATSDPDHLLRALLARAAGAEGKDIVNWELNVFDTQAGSLWGPDQEFLADSQLDNLASCHAALSALVAAESPVSTCVCALFDHEEVGSESAAGAGGSFVSDVLSRIAGSSGTDDEGYRCALARSSFISADMAHAYHPNFPAAYEPEHRVRLNGGPVIKTNANQRYGTGAETAARFIEMCDSAGVPYQHYAHRTDLGCGSTIGPIVSARLGIPCVDVGSPMWAMHSVRESAGVLDHSYMIAVLAAAFQH